MKNLFVTVTCLAITFSIPACKNATQHVIQTSSSTGSTPLVKESIHVKTDSTTVSIEYAGDLKLNENETGFAALTPGGYVRYNNGKEQLLVNSDTSGALTYIHNGKAFQPGDSGRVVLAGAVQQMLWYGFNAHGHMATLYAKGGKAALIAELPLLKSAELRNQYFHYLLDSTKLSPEETSALIVQAGASGSDHDKAALLQKIPQQPLTTTGQWVSLLQQTESLKGDNEKGDVLKQFAQKMPVEAPVQKAYRHATATITAPVLRSEVEKAGNKKSA